MTFKIIFLTITFTSSKLLGQVNYEQYNVLKVLSYATRAGSCYNPTSGIGYYACIEIPLGVLIRQSTGKEANVCCNYYKIDGNFVENVNKDFGKYNKLAFKAAQLSLREYKVDPGLKLEPELSEKLSKFSDLLNSYIKRLDLEEKPDEIFNVAAVSCLYELTEAFLKSDAGNADKLRFLEDKQKTASTLFEISTKGILNVSTSLIPFVSDARDFYELVNGRDLITGENIDGFGRVLSGISIIAGSGVLYRKAIDNLKESFYKKAITESIGGLPKLKYTGTGGWISDAGIIYLKQTEKYENKLRHILRHCTPDASKDLHTVFSVSPKLVPQLIDEGWLKGATQIADKSGDAYLVDMLRPIGTKGETKLKIILKKGTKVIESAYPQ